MVTEGERGREVATSRKSRMSPAFYQSLAFYFIIPSAIQVAAAHPSFDLRIGDQRASRDPEALSRLCDEQSLSSAGKRIAAQRKSRA